MSSQILWGNSLIRIDSQPVFILQSWNAGLVSISDLYNGNSLMPYYEIISKYGNILTWYQHYQLLEAIPILWRQSISAYGANPTIIGTNVNKMNGISARNVYSQLIDTPELFANKLAKWNYTLDANLDDNEMFKIINAIYKVTIATKYRDFQYRLLTHSLITNKMLCIWKIVDSNTCDFCAEAVETYPHLFYDCSIVQELWNYVKRFLWDNLIRSVYRQLEFSVQNVLFNTVHPSFAHIVNFIVLIVKQFIYRCKCLKTPLSPEQAIGEVDYVFRIEGQIAREKNKWNKHVSKWKPLKPSLACDMVQVYINDYIQAM